jgi:hypothetical protein
MTNRRQRQPASDEAAHTIPEDASVLAPPRQRAMPIPADSESKQRQRRLVHGHSIVSDVSTHNRPQPLALLGDGFVHSSLELGFHLIQLRLQPFPNRLPQHREPSIALLLYADVRKAEKVERLRFPFSTPLPLVDRIRTELEQSRFLRAQFQIELLHSLSEFRPELIGIRFAVSGRAMARTGLRMMPAFPSPSLRFRTAGFPQYGSKAGVSDGAFPIGAGYRVPRFASVLRALRLHRRDPRTVPRFVARLSASVRADYSAPPQGPSLRSGFYCPSPSSLTRPHPSHSRAHPDFTALRLIRDALAVRCRLGDPRVVPGFHGTFLLGMLFSKTAGSPPAAFAQFFADVAGLRPALKGSALPSDPIIRFRWAVVFAATAGSVPRHDCGIRASPDPGALAAWQATACPYRGSERNERAPYGHRELARRGESRLGVYFNRRRLRLVIGVCYAGQGDSGVVLAGTVRRFRSSRFSSVSERVHM